MAKITHKKHGGGRRPRRRLGQKMVFHSIFDKERTPWSDPRKPGVPYKYRYDLTPPGYTWDEIAERANAVLKATRYKPYHKKPSTRKMNYGGSLNPNRPVSHEENIVDYLGGFLGMHWKRYRLGYMGIGGPNPFSLVVHGQRDLIVMVEDVWRPLMVEFVVAHEIGHYVLHTSGGRIPSAWPRVSSGLHDAEATLFAAWFCLEDTEMEKIKKVAEGSVTAGAYLVSEMFRWARYIPPTGIPKKKKLKRKYASKSYLTEREKAVRKLKNPDFYEDS